MDGWVGEEQCFGVGSCQISWVVFLLLRCAHGSLALAGVAARCSGL